MTSTEDTTLFVLEEDDGTESMIDIDRFGADIRQLGQGLSLSRLDGKEHTEFMLSLARTATPAYARTVARAAVAWFTEHLLIEAEPHLIEIGFHRLHALCFTYRDIAPTRTES